MRSFAWCVLLAACGGGGVAPEPDGGPDGGSGDSGLYIAWSANPVLPGTIEDGLTVTSAHFSLEYLQVIGDAGPGDLRTTALVFALAWDATNQPKTIAFPDAPTGLYSKVSLHVNGGSVIDAYEIKGTAKVAGVTHPFRIHDRDELRVSIDHVNTTLGPTGAVTIPIQLALSDAISGVNFSLLVDDGEALELESGDPQMAAFRTALGEAFAVHPGE